MQNLTTKQQREEWILKHGGKAALRNAVDQGQCVVAILDRQADVWRILHVAYRNDVVADRGMQLVDHRLDIVSEKRETIGERWGSAISKSVYRANLKMWNDSLAAACAA
jgi:hypothetical protein